MLLSSRQGEYPSKNNMNSRHSGSIPGVSSESNSGAQGNVSLPSNFSDNGSNPALLDSRKSSSKPRTLSQVLASNLHNTNQYLAQEKAYLKRIRDQGLDDYYTKGISGADADLRHEHKLPLGLDEEDDDDNSSQGNSDSSTDSEDDKYQIDYTLAFDIMKNSNSKLSIDNNIKTISRDNVKDPAVIERLEWQAMLLSVLTGDVVRSEKTKIIGIAGAPDGSDQSLKTNYKKNLWYGIRAKLFDRLEDDQRKITLYRRNLVDQLIEKIMNYEIQYGPEDKSPRDQIVDILDQYEKACELWRTLEEMRNDKPACASEAFQDRIDALTAWLSITDAIDRGTTSYRLWIGNDDLDIARGLSELPPEAEGEALTQSKNKMKKIFEVDNKSLAERIVKEKDVHLIFRKRIFLPLAPWMVKSKDTYIRLGVIFETLKLPDYVHNLIDLCLVPMRLIKEIINIRMRFAVKLQNPTLMMIDQMIEDFKSYISIALEVKSGIMEYCRSDYEKTWYIRDLFEKDIEEFDQVVLLCVHYYLTLLNKKLIESSKSSHLFRTYKEPEELEAAWAFLRNLGQFIDGGGNVVAVNITNITSRLCQKLSLYFNHQVNNPPTSSNGATEFSRWYTSTTDNFGQLRRKIARFTGEISRNFTNSFLFELSHDAGKRPKNILEMLKKSKHFLVYTGNSEAQGMYFFASKELIDNEAEIRRIMNGSNIGSDSEDSFSQFSSLLQMSERDVDSYNVFEEGSDLDYATSYVVAYCPDKPIVWDGEILKMNIDEIPIKDVKVGQMLLISSLPYFNLHFVKDRFLDSLAGMSRHNIVKLVEQRSSISEVHHELTKINKIFSKMTLAVLDSVGILISKCKAQFPEGGYQELVNSYFVYARDFGKSSVKWLDSSRKSTVIMRLIQLSISWVSFISDECVPTDRKTFRWCVLALEFAMEMTRGFNVLVLGEDQFNKLRLKVARCMSLLISHFDIMGARSSEAEQRRLLKWYSQRQDIHKTANDEQALAAYKQDLMSQIEEIEAYRSDVQEQLNSIGRVLDVSDSEYHFVTLLASSFSSVSIRWQKGKFIGGGSFGQVFAAVNLDTGGVMAVKEIVFHDSQSLKLIPSIKEEMTVLEMLNHPNIVQYFGVEVHRDKVYIFMEYCESGSLAGLLAHGRIEDEMVIQIYTLQMLEGLAYLHQSGVVHRDIKPENILLDHNGVIKFVDFGAAKVIATSGRTRRTLTNGLRSQPSSNPENLNSMTGTPMYMSPEVITGQGSTKNGVVDVWSLGCCVLEMATGRRPWANLDNEWAIMYHIAAGHKPLLPSQDQLSPMGIKFLSRCLEHDPAKRPSAAELLNDPWIGQIRLVAFGSSESGGNSLNEAGHEPAGYEE